MQVGVRGYKVREIFVNAFSLNVAFLIIITPLHPAKVGTTSSNRK
jgi:hypothetical protein